MGLFLSSSRFGWCRFFVRSGKAVLRSLIAPQVAREFFPLEAVSSPWPVDRRAKRIPLWRWGRLVPVANRRAPRASRSALTSDGAARAGGIPNLYTHAPIHLHAGTKGGSRKKAASNIPTLITTLSNLPSIIPRRAPRIAIYKTPLVKRVVSRSYPTALQQLDAGYLQQSGLMMSWRESRSYLRARPDGRFHPLRRQRQLSDPHPGCIGEGIGDRSGSRTPCGFAGTEQRLPRAIAATAAVLKVAVLAGHGLVCLPIYLVGDLLQSGRLVAVLDDYTPTCRTSRR